MVMNELIRLKTKRLVIIGDGAVGKTTLIQRLLENSSLESEQLEAKRTPFMNIEMLHMNKEKVLDNDLAGQQSEAHPLKLLPDQVLGTADIIILAFALNQFSSLAHLEQWYSILQDYYIKHNSPIPPILLVGTKCDQPIKIDKLLIDRVMQASEILDYIETSSATGAGIEDLRNKLAVISDSDYITHFQSLRSISYKHNKRSFSQHTLMKTATF